MMRTMSLVPLLSVAVLGCAADSPRSGDDVSSTKQEWSTSLNNTMPIAHEDILSFAIDMANEKLGNTFFSTFGKGLACHENDQDSSPVKLLQGNCHTDDPDDDPSHQLKNYYNVPDVDWDHWKSFLRELHAMRNTYEDAVGRHGEPAYRSCERAKARIIAATKKAMTYWSSNRPMADYWLGHASHIVEDSFSNAHTARSNPFNESTSYGGSETYVMNRGLTDLCTAGGEGLDNVCTHTLDTAADYAYSSNIFPSRKFDNLKTPAKNAVLANAGYLRAVAEYVNAGRQGDADLEARLNEYFHIAGDVLAGWFYCPAPPTDNWYPCAVEYSDVAGIKQVCYLSLDLNCAEPEIAAIRFFWDLLVPGAPVVLDDYGSLGYVPQKLAMDAFAAEVNVPVLTLPTGQGLIIKPPRAGTNAPRQ